MVLSLEDVYHQLNACLYSDKDVKVICKSVCLLKMQQGVTAFSNDDILQFYLQVPSSSSSSSHFLLAIFHKKHTFAHELCNQLYTIHKQMQVLEIRGKRFNSPMQNSFFMLLSHKVYVFALIMDAIQSTLAK